MAGQAPETVEGRSAAGDGGRTKKPNVDFPFKLTIQHGALDFKGMFASAEAFDFYEVNGVAGENLDKARRELCIDIVEVTPTTTGIPSDLRGRLAVVH
jgi:hypothetical protein